nr:hypothetical protein AF2225 [Bradyrhizobium sp. DOA9]
MPARPFERRGRPHPHQSVAFSAPEGRGDRSIHAAARRRRAAARRTDRGRQQVHRGLNYADHAAEANLPLPSEPILFQKAITSLSGGPNDDVLPKGSKKSDWEVELGMVIGTRASYVERGDALTLPATAS